MNDPVCLEPKERLELQFSNDWLIILNLVGLNQVWKSAPFQLKFCNLNRLCTQNSPLAECMEICLALYSVLEM